MIKNDVQIKQASTIHQVLDLYSVEVNFKGRCKCPVHHADKDANFKVQENKGTCFSACGGKSWNPVELLMELSGADYPTAIQRLAEINNIEVIFDGSKDAEIAKRESDERACIRQFNKLYANKCFASNPNLNKQGKTSFGKNNYSYQTMKTFGLGQSGPSDIVIGLGQQLGISKEQLSSYGFLNKRGNDKFSSRLIFPITDQTGNVAGFTARKTIQDEKSPKYINSADSVAYHKGTILYGLYQNRKAIVAAGFCIVVEGNVDLLTMYDHGIYNAVALSGTAFTDEQAKLLSRFTDRVVFLLDDDEAGKKALERAIYVSLKAGLVTDACLLSEGHDPDSFLVQYGQEVFDRMIAEKSQDAADWMVFQGYEKENLLTVKDSTKKAVEVLKTIREQTVIFEHYLAHFSKELSEKAIKIALGIPLDGQLNPQEPSMHTTLFDHYAEFSIISILLKDSSLVDYFFNQSGYEMTADYFHHEQHKKVFSVIESLYKSGNPVTFDSVLHKISLTYNQQVLQEYLSHTTDLLPDNLRGLAFIVRDLKIRRRMFDVGDMAMRLSYQQDEESDSSLVVIGSSLDAIDGLCGGGGKMLTISEIVEENLARLEKLVKDREAALANGEKFVVAGLATGLRHFDAVTSGLHKTDLFILAARPGMGKTSLMLTAVLNALLRDEPVLIFSLEMSNLQLVQRLISMLSGVNSNKFRSGDLTLDELEAIGQASQRIKQMPLFINDSAGISIDELARASRRMVKTEGIQLIVIDYVQLMSGLKGGNRESVVSEISRKLKVVAKDNDVPVFALSQLSRAVETRGGDKRPMLSDLRESGGIEQDADIVTFIYRPSYYGIMEDADGRSLDGVTELIISKHRHGELKTVEVKFLPETTLFVDNDYHPENGFRKNQESQTTWTQSAEPVPMTGVQMNFPSFDDDVSTIDSIKNMSGRSDNETLIF